MLPETGHMNPSFKIARQLKMRGHRVCYLAIPDFKDCIRSQGFEFFPLFNDLYPNGFTSRQAFKDSNLETLDAIKMLIGAKLANGKTTMADLLKREIDNLIKKLQPELFIVDILLPEVALTALSLNARTLLVNTNLDNRLNEGDPLAYRHLSGLTELILCPQEFDFPRAQRRAHRHFHVEPSIDLQRPEAPFPWDKIDSRKPLIYCSLGTQNRLFDRGRDFLQTVILALSARQDWQLVVSIGADRKPDEFHSVAPNVVLVNSAPQIEILKRASVMITHGGLNSIKESIYFGVPMIVCPIMREQPMNAARVEYHRLGVRADILKATAESIHSLIEKILGDGSYRKRVELMGERFRAMENSERAASIIETMLGVSKSYKAFATNSCPVIRLAK
jgi:zeaxanthin glucosyltransferase